MQSHQRAGRPRIEALLLGAALGVLHLGCQADDGAPDRFPFVPAGGEESGGGGDGEAITQGAKQLAVGGRFTCVLEHDGAVLCWGDNRFGQLGQGHIEDLGDDELPNAAGAIDIGAPVSSISAGRDYACASRSDDRLICWGLSLGGALGYGDLDIIGNNELPSDAGFVDVGAAIRSVHPGPHHHTCAITTGDELLCWGSNGAGQLGYAHTADIGDDEAPSSAGYVALGAAVLDVATSWANTCALLEGGDVLCWGQGSATLGAGYELGENIGDDESPLSMPPLELGGPAQAIEAGWDHFCALLETGEVVCWGANHSGQLGYGHFEVIGDDETPARAGPVQLGEPAVGLSLGLDHSCALAESGSVYCWGNGNQGRLGHPEVMGSIGGQLLPVEVGPVELPGPADEIGAGEAHTCARIGDEIYCWGGAWRGALGYGNLAHLGDDEPPASGGPVRFRGGQGNGGVAPIHDELDGIADARVELRWQHPKPPAALAVGNTVHVYGSHNSAFGCETCGDSTVIRAADGHTLVLAIIDEHDRLHPEPGILKMIGLEPSTWLDPLELETLDLGLCPQMAVEELEGCVGTRLSLAVCYPKAPTARLLDASRGRVGGGYVVSARRLQDWSEACGAVDKLSNRRLVVIRQPCAPSCGAVDVISECQPPEMGLDHARISFFGPKRPRDPGIDVTCEVLAHTFHFYEWRIDLDCIGLP